MIKNYSFKLIQKNRRRMKLQALLLHINSKTIDLQRVRTVIIFGKMVVIWPCENHVICHPLVISIASSSSHACLHTKLSKVCAPPDVPPTLELADFEVVLEMPSTVSAATPSLDASAAGTTVIVQSVDSTSGLQPCLPVPHRQRAEHFNLGIMFCLFLIFHHNLIVQTPFCKCIGILLAFRSVKMPSW